MPRKQLGALSQLRAQRIGPGSARSLLLTLLGEFVLPAPQPAWTAQLLHGLAGVGVAEKAARQALARAATAGWTESESNGRRIAWRLSERGRRLIADGSSRLRSLANNGAAWDGNWLIMHISLPESRRVDRLRMYRALSWIGCGNPMAGVWINPHADRATEARLLIEALKLDRHTLALTARSLDFGIPQQEVVAKAWNLETVAGHYRRLVKRFGALRPRTDDEGLFAYIKLVNELQRLPSIDPGLPRDLLPPDWDRRRHADQLWALREEWRKPAHVRWDALSAELAG